MAEVIVAVYNSVNDACKQKMLRYARGSVLDALGENRDTPRLDPTFATTTLPVSYTHLTRRRPLPRRWRLAGRSERRPGL